MVHPDLSDWQGRDDTVAEGERALRWHQQVIAWFEEAIPGVTILGFSCDEGVRRNRGRIGAASAPSAIRKMLSNLAWHQLTPVYDHGDVDCPDGELDTAQFELAERVDSLLKRGQRPLVIGGGHETAWGTFLGLTASHPESTIGIINIDAHFDLRQSDKAHSGTPFAQMAEWCHYHDKPFHYLCLGIAEAANTATLFDRANALNTRYVLDEDLSLTRYQHAMSNLLEFIAHVDCLYLSIDCDVLPVSTMKAVSAPAAYGVALEVVLQLVQLIAGSGKLKVADVVEYNPLLDDDESGARVVARLIWHLLRHWHPLSEGPT